MQNATKNQKIKKSDDDAEIVRLYGQLPAAFCFDVLTTGCTLVSQKQCQTIWPTYLMICVGSFVTVILALL